MTVRSDDGLGQPPGDADAPLDVAQAPLLAETPSIPRHEPEPEPAAAIGAPSARLARAFAVTIGALATLGLIAALTRCPALSRP